ncbi:hypothetical protein [Rufibacter tibetensis]|uniref:Uncharacterized protein n=1 Tax=Rufibacter tibetensis TaxID=512763 RepID=A0A0P0CYQ3_9BACT|nr:hypothetical protein [Rufibacter tibetensis]ALJ00590.1 hypothetical protein DC20_18450 [Rufibacter tibetensis]
MAYVPILLAVLALIVAGFTFYKVSGLVYRIHSLEKKNRELEAGLRSMENLNKRTGKIPQPENTRQERGSQGQPNVRQPQQPRVQQQPQEPRQKQQGQQPGRGQQPQEPRVQGQPQQQRNPQEPRVRQEGQPQQQRQPREPREPRENRQPQEPRQKQIQPPLQSDGTSQNPRAQQQPQRRNDNRRREQVNAPDGEQASLVPPIVSPTLGKEIVGDDLLNELTQQAAPQPEAPVSRTRYAIIPEDGVIKTHQLQQRPDSDSYLEIDTPAEGSTNTRYRFNLSGNQAFVISQGMDRLENAFSFEKPSNRKVSQIVLQGDGVLSRTSSGWKIQEKAKIDFR